MITVFCWLALYAGGVSAELAEGRDYFVIDARPAAATERVEVIEFFFYGCNSCYRLNPVMQAWVDGSASRIDFRRIPALRRTAWKPLSNLFFTLQSLGVLPQLHGRVYEAIHEHGRKLSSRSEQIAWAAEQGLEPAQFEAILDSDETLIETQLARDATVAYGVRVTPSIAVGGRFMTTGAMIGSAPRLSLILDELIEMALASRQ